MTRGRIIEKDRAWRDAAVCEIRWFEIRLGCQPELGRCGDRFPATIRDIRGICGSKLFWIFRVTSRRILRIPSVKDEPH
jgi:hypothetical protein